MPVTVLWYGIRHLYPFKTYMFAYLQTMYELFNSCFVLRFPSMCVLCVFKDCLYACVMGRKFYSPRSYLYV
jgi:hypothetical protein